VKERESLLQRGFLIKNCKNCFHSERRKKEVVTSKVYEPKYVQKGKSRYIQEVVLQENKRPVPIVYCILNDFESSSPNGVCKSWKIASHKHLI
jgi:hypothetical protein